MNFISSSACLSDVPHQRAEGGLDLAVALQGERHRLARFYQRGSLKARCIRTGDAIELVAINISGGMAGGDTASVKMELMAGAKAVFTTQAAERIYRSLGEVTRVETRLIAGPGAHLMYLPQETILFDGFGLKRSLEIDLAEGASFVGVEGLVFGRLAMGEVIERGSLSDKITLRREERLVWRDVSRVEGHVFARLDRPGIGNGARAMASLIAVGDGMMAKLPAVQNALSGHVAGLSTHDGMILLRLLAADSASLRRVVTAALSMLGNGALPRVWQS
ncbi:urease accessory protein UreD [Acidocella sp.]|uniref:urease accessory protein UreD n=1 Tax=Acidocella sp. TaxID=50710 RepID=UPI003CFC32A2